MLPEIPRIGHPVLDGIIQAVVSVGAVLFSLLIVWLRWGAPQWERLNAKVRSIKEQTNNSHETNLRDDLDKVLEQVEQVSAALARMQSETNTALLNVVKRLDAIAEDFAAARVEHADFRKDIGGLRDEMRHARKRHDASEDRIIALETRGESSFCPEGRLAPYGASKLPH